MELVAVFPHLSVDYLKKVLAHCNGNLETAANFLFSGDSLPPEEISIKDQKPKTKKFYGSEDSIISDGLRHFINSPQFSDVVLMTSDGAKVNAHQVILASRSPCFSAYLESLSSNEEGQKILELEISQKMLMYLLNYIYADSVEFPDDDAHDLLTVADLMCLPQLRKACELSPSESTSTFSEDILKTLGNKEYFPDVIIKVQDDKIACHKVILSAGCDYFKAMFGGMMKESHNGEISMPETNSDIFKTLLKVIYSNGSIINQLITEENALDLFAVSNQYMILPLQKACENMIKDSLDVDNVCQILDIAGSLSASLKVLCMRFMYVHFEDVLNTEGFKNLSQEQQTEIMKRYDDFKNNMMETFVNHISQTELENMANYMRNQITEFLAKYTHFQIKKTYSNQIQTPLGDVEIKFSNFELSAPTDNNKKVVRSKDIDVEFHGNTLEVDIFVHNISFNGDLNWSYRQLTMPFLEDDSNIQIGLEGARLVIIFRVVPTASEINIPQLSLKEFTFELNNMKIDFKEGANSWVTQHFLKVFHSEIKPVIEDEFGAKLQQALKNLIKGINDLGVKEFADEKESGSVSSSGSGSDSSTTSASSSDTEEEE